MPKTTESLAARLRRLREQAGWTVYRLAQESGLDAAQLYRLESGENVNPRWASIQAIASALRVPTDALRVPPAPSS